MTTTLRFDRLTKHFGATVAVEDLSATVHPGRVTAFLGPNGAGKTTTLRMLLGLVSPTSGSATFDGRRYDELTAPTREVGALLEATGFHPGREDRPRAEQFELHAVEHHAPADALLVVAVPALRHGDDRHLRVIDEVLAHAGRVERHLHPVLAQVGVDAAEGIAAQVRARRPGGLVDGEVGGGAERGPDAAQAQTLPAVGTARRG